MAAGILSKPGSESGPCLTNCNHSDCDSTREMAQTVCVMCGEPIGYERRFYRDPKRGLVHAVCLESER